MKLSYWNTHVTLLIGIACLISDSSSEGQLFYRKDYKYINVSNAFYKLHRERKTWSDAVLACAGEGAQLLIPESEEEILQILKLSNKGEVYFWMGIHDLYAEGDFITLDGKSTTESYVNWAIGEPNNAENSEDCTILRKDGFFVDVDCKKIELFFCKKSAIGLTQNTLCETYDVDYTYILEMDECYKFHTKPLSWSNAFKTCRSEEAQLGIINSNVEANIFINKFTQYPATSVKGNFERGLIYVGFNDLISQGLYLTIEGKPLSETGYEQWTSDQPESNRADEHCGTMLRDGYYKLINCDIRAMFICEKTLTNTTNVKIDTRFSVPDAIVI